MIFDTEARDFESVKADLIDCHDSSDDPPMEPGETWAPTDNQVYASMSLDTETDWEDAQYELKKHLGKFDMFLVVGSSGTWQGPRSGGKFCKNLQEMMQCVSACEQYELYDRNGRLCIEGSHHDGHNSFEVKALTERGRAYAERMGYDNCRELHKTLWDWNLYTKDIHFSHEVWGCPKREHEKETT